MQPVQKRVIHGGRVKEAELNEGRSFLDFSASINPFPPKIPVEVTPEMIEAYPDDEYSAVKASISSSYNVPADAITVGNGSIEVLRTYCRAKLGPHKSFATTRPTFGEYEYSAALTGAVPTDDSESADVLFLCNPNNPDGALISQSDLVSIIRKRGRKGKDTLVDEAFMELADRNESVAGIRDPHLFVMKSLTKSFAVPGIRFGFGLGDPELVSCMEAIRAPWTVNSVAEHFARIALSRLPDLQTSRLRIAEERIFLQNGLESAGLRCHPSSTNFLLATGPRRAPEICKSLREAGILVRDCTSFGLPYSIRVAVRKREENERLLKEISRCLP